MGSVELWIGVLKVCLATSKSIQELLATLREYKILYSFEGRHNVVNNGAFWEKEPRKNAQNGQSLELLTPQKSTPTVMASLKSEVIGDVAAKKSGRLRLSARYYNPSKPIH